MADHKSILSTYKELLPKDLQASDVGELAAGVLQRLCATRVEAHWAAVYMATAGKDNAKSIRQNIFTELNNWACDSSLDMSNVLEYIRKSILESVKDHVDDAAESAAAKPPGTPLPKKFGRGAGRGGIGGRKKGRGRLM